MQNTSWQLHLTTSGFEILSKVSLHKGTNFTPNNFLCRSPNSHFQVAEVMLKNSAGYFSFKFKLRETQQNNASSTINSRYNTSIYYNNLGYSNTNLNCSNIGDISSSINSTRQVTVA